MQKASGSWFQPMCVKLIPKTAKGKQRVKQYGDTGKVCCLAESVSFSSEKGPWLLVEAADPSSRWVNLHNDKDFSVELVSKEIVKNVPCKNL